MYTQRGPVVSFVMYRRGRRRCAAVVRGVYFDECGRKVRRLVARCMFFLRRFLDTLPPSLPPSLPLFCTRCRAVACTESPKRRLLARVPSERRMLLLLLFLLFDERVLPYGDCNEKRERRNCGSNVVAITTRRMSPPPVFAILRKPRK